MLLFFLFYGFISSPGCFAVRNAIQFAMNVSLNPLDDEGHLCFGHNNSSANCDSAVTTASVFQEISGQNCLRYKTKLQDFIIAQRFNP